MIVEDFKKVAIETLLKHPKYKSQEWKDWRPERTPQPPQIADFYHATLWDGEHIVGFFEIRYDEKEPETFITNWLDEKLDS